MAAIKHALTLLLFLRALLLPAVVQALPSCDMDPLNDPFAPAQNVQTTATGYDLSKARWKDFMDAIDCLGKQEHRVCTFLIRMHFHDAGAVDDKHEGGASGSDASVVINDSEAKLPPSTQHGEAPMDRYVLGKLAAKFGLSYADGLAIGAAQCTLTLKSTVNIPQHCSTNGFPLLVGKLDNADVNIDSVAGKLPGGFDTADTWLVFWKNYLNSRISDSKWQFSVDDAVALMGSHILLDNHVCSRGASGYYRNHHWDNGYFQDVMSGQLVCFQSDQAHGYSIATNGFTGSQTSQCDFDTDAFEKRSQNAEHKARKLQVEAGIFCDDSCQNPLKLDARWRPDNTRAVCYGDPICKPCGPLDRRSFCQLTPARGLLGFLFEPHARDQSFWPYTVNDCFLATAARDPKNYCQNALLGCPTIKSPPAEPYPGFYNDLVAVQKAYNEYKNDPQKWMEAFAIAQCKLTNVDAHFVTGGGIDLMELLPVGTDQGMCSAASAEVLAVVQDILAPPPCEVPSPVTPDSPPPRIQYPKQPCGRVGFDYVNLYVVGSELVPAGTPDAPISYVTYCQKRLLDKAASKKPGLLGGLLSTTANAVWATPTKCVFKRIPFGIVKKGPNVGDFGVLIIADDVGAQHCDVTLLP